jgi:hypothetical protein
MYVIRFDTGGKPRTFPLKYLAYAESSPVQLTVGARVIAQYVEDKDGKLKPSSYYAGVIAEAPKTLNQYRYLVFFDDGYAQYCTHEQVKPTYIFFTPLINDKFITGDNGMPKLTRCLARYTHEFPLLRVELS